MEAHGVDHWTLVGEKLTAEKRLAEDAKKASLSIYSFFLPFTNSAVFSRGWGLGHCRRILVRTLPSFVICSYLPPVLYYDMLNRIIV